MPEDLVTRAATGSVADVVEAVKRELIEDGLTLLATVDHAAGARSVGMDLPDEVVLAFGNPAVGTRLMQDDPRVGLDLPLRLLVHDDHGTTRLVYRRPRALADEFGLHDDDGVLGTLTSAMERLVDAVVGNQRRERR